MSILSTRATRGSQSDSVDSSIYCSLDTCGSRINVEHNDSYVSCRGCHMHFHMVCVGISRSLYSEIVKSNSQVKWYCLECNSVACDPVDVANSNKLAIANLVGEVAKLTELVTRLVSNSQSVNPVTAPDQDQIVSAAVDEMHDREARSSNLVIFNLVEGGDDKEICNQLLLATKSDPLSVPLKSVHRLGQLDENEPKNRPIKLVFGNSIFANTVLKNARNLADTADQRFKNCSIRKDHTPLQQRQYKKLLKERYERKQLGEDVVIRGNAVVARFPGTDHRNSEIPPPSVRGRGGTRGFRGSQGSGRGNITGAGRGVTYAVPQSSDVRSGDGGTSVSQ